MRKNDRERVAAQTALDLMANANVSPTPDNFEIFYRHAVGEMTGVGGEVAKILASGECFTPAVLHYLHERASGALSRIAMDSIALGMADVLTTVLENIGAAGRDAELYGQTLSAASSEFGGTKTPDALQKVVETLKSATQTMEARTSVLEVELERSSSEVKELKAQLDTVRKESLTDALTDVCNRKAFDSELTSAVARATKLHEPLSLLMCDIDHFKMFNDTWGHQTGDHVLRHVAACLSQHVKGRDTVARYGGEEFAVILRQSVLEDAINLAEEMRAAVEKKKLVKRSTGDVLGSITISTGVAQFVPGEAIADFIGQADRCLYAAKHAGRNRVIGVKPLCTRSGQDDTV